jgi:hypothetical protein
VAALFERVADERAENVVVLDQQNAHRVPPSGVTDKGNRASAGWLVRSMRVRSRLAAARPAPATHGSVRPRRGEPDRDRRNRAAPIREAPIHEVKKESHG